MIEEILGGMKYIMKKERQTPRFVPGAIECDVHFA